MSAHFFRKCHNLRNLIFLEKISNGQFTGGYSFQYHKNKMTAILVLIFEHDSWPNLITKKADDYFKATKFDRANGASERYG